MIEETNDEQTPEDCGSSDSHCSGDISRVFKISRLEEGDASECVAVHLVGADGDPDRDDCIEDYEPKVIEVFDHNARRLHVGQLVRMILRPVEEL